MLENKKPATKEIAKHIDSCLSCYSCMTTCPSGVNYMHLIDHGRNYVEETYKRPFLDRVFRNILSFVLPKPKVFLLKSDWKKKREKKINFGCVGQRHGISMLPLKQLSLMYPLSPILYQARIIHESQEQQQQRRHTPPCRTTNNSNGKGHSICDLGFNSVGL